MIHRALWAARYWLVALGLALIAFWNQIFNSGWVHIAVTGGARTSDYYYYIGGDAALWGLVTGILLAVTVSSLRNYYRKDRWILQQARYHQPTTTDPQLDTEP